LFEYAGNFKYLTIASWVLAVISAFAALVPFYFIWCLIKEVLFVIFKSLLKLSIGNHSKGNRFLSFYKEMLFPARNSSHKYSIYVISAFAALVPFYFIWCLIKEVLRVASDYGAAQNLAFYGWSAVGTAVLAMLIYIGALICSHLSAFRVQANMRSQLMRHILSLPLGFMEEEGSGKIRKIVNESSAATETYIEHQQPDKCVAFATPVGLAILLLIFDWRLGLLCLIPVVAAFAVMSTMMGENMKKKMEEYQNSLEEMSNEVIGVIMI